MMKEDYLWDKTGEEADIEKLENALQVFRYKETAPPELPAKVLPFRKEEPQRAPRRIFSFAAVAAAACLVFGVIALGVWFQVLNNNAPVQANLTKKDEPQIELPQQQQQQQQNPAISKNDDSPVDNVGNPKQFSARKSVATRQTAPASLPLKISQKIAKARKAKAPRQTEQLTKEEQYAYDQLMLALSIASSKFKLVRDKIDGAAAEEKNTVLANGQ